jgi:hypothetical protein
LRGNVAMKYRVNELFGQYTNGSSFPDLHQALERQDCPWSDLGCYKNRKSDPSTMIGVCSVSLDDGQPVLICPNRLLEGGRIFIDCLDLLAGSMAGSDLYLVPEVKLPVGRIDYMLVAARNGHAFDFVAIELQTLDTTGSIWRDREEMLFKEGYQVDDIAGTRASLNWRMTAKTILTQCVQKSEIFDAMGKNLVLVCQQRLVEYMQQNFDFSAIHSIASERDVFHIHGYDYRPLKDKMRLSLAMTSSFDIDGVKGILGKNKSINQGIEQVLQTLDARLCDDYRFNPFP